MNLAKFLKIYFFAEDVRTINCFLNSHKKRKDSQETWVVLLIFSLELEISGVAVQSIHQNRENGDFWEGLVSENNFEAVLASFCCYDYGAKDSEVVQKIATD